MNEFHNHLVNADAEMSTSDTLVIEAADVAARLHLGVSESERERPQTVLVSVAIGVPRAPTFDQRTELSQTIDYARMLDFIAESLPAEGPFVLIEAVAERVLAEAFALAPNAAWAEVSVKKPSVATPPALVSVRLRRWRRP